jgi:hypothetical protein
VKNLFDMVTRSEIGSRLYRFLPAKRFDRLPELALRGMDDGHGGLIRGWGLNCGPLPGLIRRDPLYRKARRAAAGRSVITEVRRLNLFLLIRFYFSDLESKDIAELGVYRGGNIFFMATLLKELYPGAKVYAFDTYSGMPETKSGLDLHTSGDFADVSLAEITRSASERGLKNIEFIKGDVRETLRPFNASIGLAHIDLDIYESISFAQDIMWNHLVTNGYLVYDDATAGSCLGATRAVEDFLVGQRVHSEQIYPHFVFRKDS